MRKAPSKQLVHARCVDLSFEGKGVCKAGDFTVFVDGMFIGEEGDIEITYKRNGAYFGELRKLTQKSDKRIQPLCKICHSCGGCCFQQLSYEAQLSFKARKVKEQFRKIAKLDVEVDECVGMDEPYWYRNKIQMPFAKDSRGRVYCGFYKPQTHVIVPVDECFIEDKRAKPIIDECKSLFTSMRIEPYREDERRGVVRHVLIKTSYYREQIMVVLVTACDSFPKRGELVKELTKRHPEITTVIQNVNTRDTSVILGEKERVLFGKGYIEDCLCGVGFQISSKSFYQTNPIMTEKLYSYAMEAAGLTGNEIVFDAYSGIGTIGLIASRKAKEVISVEIVPSAVKDGIKNSKRNGITNFRMYCDDATSFINKMAKANEKIDVLFMDPPRKGSDERFLKAVRKLKPTKVVYVSCDPSTLARDIAYLTSDYQVDSVRPFDMFPQTFHVETVATLTLKNNDRIL